MPFAIHTRTCSLYAVSAQDCYLLEVRRDKFRRAVDLCRNRIKNDKYEFLRSVDLLGHFSRSSVKNMTRFLVKRSFFRS